MYEKSFPHSLPVEEVYERMMGVVTRYQDHKFIGDFCLTENQAPHTIRASARFLSRRVEGEIQITKDKVTITGNVNRKLATLFKRKAEKGVESLLT
jgi:hypothetical protein